MRTIEVSAKTRELAIKDALQQLGVERDEVHVEILDEGSAGLFGFGARNVKLKVSTDVPGSEPERQRPTHGEHRHPQVTRHEQPRREQAPREPHQQRSPQPQRGPHPPRHGQPQRDQRPQREAQPRREPRDQRPPRPDRPPRQEPAPRAEPRERRPAPAPRIFNGPPDTDAEALVREVIQRMGIEATISSATGEGGTVSIKIESPDSAILIGRKGRSLESLQYLVNRMTPKVEGDDGDRITIDIEGYLDRRQEALEELAHRLADRARETGRRQRTKPMGSQERRVIHMTLEGDESIKTFSVGDAGDRHVVIAPKDEKPGDDRPPRGRGFRGDRGPRGGQQRDERQPRKPRGLFSEQPRQPQEQQEGGDEPHAEGNGAPRRRRRNRRGGRGRGGPRPEAPVAQSDTVESGPQES